MWKGKKLIAYEVAKDYFEEKEIRRASQKGELCCPDPECKSKILKYCHGEIKQPYFAHREETDCDYLRYEKTSGVFHTLRLLLFEHFSACDYPVLLEIKTLDHHYSHLYFEWEDGKKTAIELGTKRSVLKDVEGLNQEYKQKGIEPIWLVVDKGDKLLDEKHTYFLKRFCLNESVNKSLIVLDYAGNKVYQYKRVPMIKCKTEMGDYLVDFQRMFVYEGILMDLVFENGTLNLRGFDKAYEKLLKMRQEQMVRFEDRLRTRQELAATEEERRRVEEVNLEQYRQEKLAEEQRFKE